MIMSSKPIEDWKEADDWNPPKDGKWVWTIVEIRQNSTGTIREYASRELLMDGEDTPCTYLWSEGNYACDCNRGDFFAQANDEDKDYDGGCGDTAYSVRLRNKKNGRVYYSEF